MTRRRGKGGDLERLRHELVTQGRVRPVEDVLAPAVGAEHHPRPAPDKRPDTRTDRLKRVNLAMDRAGVPCACDDQTPCLAHAGITGWRRWLRPK